jgi:hypothetical protein
VTSAYGFRPPNLSNDRPRYADARVAERRRRGSYRVGKSPPPRAIHRIGPWRSGMLVVRLTALIVCLHKLEILLLALFYRLYCFSTWESAFYFSATSYSTVGYGDLILLRAWRLPGPMESITGVLMCGLSVSFLFAVVHRLVERNERVELVEGSSKGQEP